MKNKEFIKSISYNAHYVKLIQNYIDKKGNFIKGRFALAKFYITDQI